jgi:hypothetical protein
MSIHAPTRMISTMQPHRYLPLRPSTRSRRGASARLALLAVVTLSFGAACSSGSDSSESADSAPAAAETDDESAAPSQAPSPDPAPTEAAPADPAPAETAAAEPPPADEPAAEGVEDLTPICDTLPPLDVISAIVGTPVSVVTDYSTPPVVIEDTATLNDRCEATGDDIGLGIFERYDVAQGDQILVAAEEIGAQVLPIDDPRLPGAIGWGNGVMIISDGVYWYATAITPTTVGVADSPEAYASSTELLAAWLGV